MIVLIDLPHSLRLSERNGERHEERHWNYDRQKLWNVKLYLYKIQNFCYFLIDWKFKWKLK